MTRVHIMLAALFIFAVTMMPFMNSVNAQFVNWDDDVYVTENPHTQSLSADNVRWIFSHSYFYSWIPVTLLSHAADVAMWGMDPKGHHLTNVVLHAFNAVWLFLAGLVLFRMANITTEKPGENGISTGIILGSGIAALLFATHPLRVESVAWVSGRKDLLCAFFLLPAFASYLRWRLDGGIRRLVYAHLLFALALLSKPMAAPFPAVLTLVDMWWTRKRYGRVHFAESLVAGKFLLYAMSAGIVIITLLGARGGAVDVLENLGSGERLLFPTYAIMFYLWKVFAPFGLSPIYPDVHPVLLYLSPLVLIGAVYAIMVLRKGKHTGLPVAYLSYILMVVPTLVGLSSGLQPLADRYTYLATISIFLFVGGCVEVMWRKSGRSLGRFVQREFIIAILLVLCGVNAYRIVRHLEVWSNSVTLWTQVMRYAPLSPQEYERRKPYLKPDYLDAMINYGTALYAIDEKKAAAGKFEDVLKFDSCNADAQYNLGNLRYEEGNISGSLAHFRKAVVCDSGYAKAYYNIGVLLSKDSTDAALASFRRAARLGFPHAQDLLRARGIGW